MKRQVIKAGVAIIAGALAVSMVGCSSPSPAPADDGDDAVTVKAGWVSAIDQIGLPAALDQGYFEDQGLDVELADPFASGVDMLNALDADQIQFAQVGTPVIGAKLKGADYVLLGNYTGSASQLGIDETMAVVSRADSGIKEGDLSTLKGKKIGVTVGSINHLYLLAVLDKLGMTTDDVQIVNTAAPDLAVALEKSGIDAAIIWDPWPLLIQQQVEGSYLVKRGGGFIGFMGYLVAKRSFAEENPEIVSKFLTARAEADAWMRDNPDDAAQVASRWMSNLDPEIAKQAMQFNVKQLDPRLSACNYAALNTAIGTLHELGAIDGTFDVNDIFMPQPNVEMVKKNAELFKDLKPIPESAQIGENFTFDPNGNQCPVS